MGTKTIKTQETKETRKTREEIISALKADSNNFNAVVTIQGLTTENKVGENGFPYVSFMLLLNKPLKAAVKQADGSYQIGTTQAVTVSYFQLAAIMRRHPFFGRFMSFIDNAVIVGGVESLFCGMQIEIIGEFVAAGEDAANPFNRNEHSYGVKDYDRYIYHITEVKEPTDILLIEEYRAIAAENRRMLIDSIRVAKEAAASRKSLLATIEKRTDESEKPF